MCMRLWGEPQFQQGESLDWDVLTTTGFQVSPVSLNLKLDLRILTALSIDTVDMPYYA
jgi:hypothetical protein